MRKKFNQTPFDQLIYDEALEDLGDEILVNFPHIRQYNSKQKVQSVIHKFVANYNQYEHVDIRIIGRMTAVECQRNLKIKEEYCYIIINYFLILYSSLQKMHSTNIDNQDPDVVDFDLYQLFSILDMVSSYESDLPSDSNITEKFSKQILEDLLF